MPLDSLMGLPTEDVEAGRSADQFVADLRERTEAAYNLAREQLQVAAEKRKATYDLRVRKTKHSVGDWI